MVKARLWWHHIHSGPPRDKPVPSSFWRYCKWRFAADESPCHNSTRSPLPSQPAVTVIAYLSQQSPNLSLHHSSVSFSSHHFLYESKQPTLLLLTPAFYLHSSPHSSVTSFFSALHYLTLLSVQSSTVIFNMISHPPCTVIQGDLQHAYYLSRKTSADTERGIWQMTEVHLFTALVWQSEDIVWESGGN